MKELVSKYRDIIPYAVFGVLTTLVNIVSYWFFAHPLKWATLPSNIGAWILSVLFAYVTNRKWVFHSEAHGTSSVLKEMISFFTARLATGVLDWFNMWLFVDIFHLNDMIIKVLSNIVVIVLNYAASKVLVFRHKSR